MNQIRVRMTELHELLTIRSCWGSLYYNAGYRHEDGSLYTEHRRAVQVYYFMGFRLTSGNDVWRNG